MVANPVLPYRKIQGPDGAIANLRDFRGHTMRGRWVDRETYVVYSYGTMIAAFDRIVRVAVVSGRRFSVTTSRHQGICRAWLGYSKDRKGVEETDEV